MLIILDLSGDKQQCCQIKLRILLGKLPSFFPIYAIKIIIKIRL